MARRMILTQFLLDIVVSHFAEDHVRNLLLLLIQLFCLARRHAFQSLALIKDKARLS